MHTTRTRDHPVDSATPTPQMQEVLDALAALNPLPLETVVPRQARELPSFANAVRLVQARRGLPPAVEEVAGIEHRLVPGGLGSEGTLVRIYTPPTGSAPLPVLVYFHGGGWVTANLDVYDASPRAGRRGGRRAGRGGRRPGIRGRRAAG